MRLIPVPFLASAVLVVGLLVAPAQGVQTPPSAGGTVSEIKVLGTSAKGRVLRAYRIGDPTSPRKVVMLSTLHGDEVGTSRILMNLIKGPAITGADLWVIPYVNRDGFARKTRKNARGVDLNRNFPTRWKRQSGKYNSGPKPSSEPETRALIRFLDAVDPRWVISLHQPLYGVDTSYGKARPLARRLVRGTGLPAKVFSCNGGCHGTMTQWFNRHHRGAALTVEYGQAVTRYQARVTGPRGLLRAVFANR